MTGIDLDPSWSQGLNPVVFEVVMSEEYQRVSREVKTIAQVFSAVGGFADSIFVGLSIYYFRSRSLHTRSTSLRNCASKRSLSK